MSENLYEVMGGQGRMRIACDKTLAEAKQIKRDFDQGCFEYDLMNPPTLIRKQPFRYGDASR